MKTSIDRGFSSQPCLMKPEGKYGISPMVIGFRTMNMIIGSTMEYPYTIDMEYPEMSLGTCPYYESLLNPYIYPGLSIFAMTYRAIYIFT